MQVSVKGQNFIVTGSTQGVGRAIAQRLAEAGAAGIMVTGRSRQRGDDAVRALADAGATAHFVAADLTRPDAADTVFDAAHEAFGTIDGLVNAAGLTNRGGAADASPELWELLFSVNARAPFFLTQRMISHLKDRNAPGTIVNILSMNVHCGGSELAVYSASKAALALLTKNTAHAHRFDGIRVNGINMGWADTPAERIMQIETLGLGEAAFAQMVARQPTGRLLGADDVARLALFLASDASVPMTGALVDQEQFVAAGPR